MKKLFAVAIAAISVVAAGCGGGDKTTAPEPTLAGTYHLQLLNNAGAPFVTSQDATYRAEIISWDITLKDDKTFTWTANLKANDNGTVTTGTESSSGTYTLTGSVVRMNDPADNSYLDATVAGNALNITIDAGFAIFKMVFTK